MVDHVVLYRLRRGTGPVQLAEVERLIHGLADAIPGIVGVRSGPNVAPRQYADGYAWGFVMTFADLAARDGYFEHPAHLAILPAVEAATADVLVFDLERVDQEA